jgi:hypothetical protein
MRHRSNFAHPTNVNFKSAATDEEREGRSATNVLELKPQHGRYMHYDIIASILPTPRKLTVWMWNALYRSPRGSGLLLFRTESPALQSTVSSQFCQVLHPVLTLQGLPLSIHPCARQGWQASRCRMSPISSGRGCLMRSSRGRRHNYRLGQYAQGDDLR